VIGEVLRRAAALAVSRDIALTGPSAGVGTMTRIGWSG
jgi:hypothetical protein